MIYDIIIPEKMLHTHGNNAYQLYDMCIHELKTNFEDLNTLLPVTDQVVASRLKLHNMLGTARILYNDTLCRKIEAVQRKLKTGKPVMNTPEMKWIEREISRYTESQWW